MNRAADDFEAIGKRFRELFPQRGPEATPAPERPVYGIGPGAKRVARRNEAAKHQYCDCDHSIEHCDCLRGGPGD